ncbi:Protein phosphatase 2C 2 [Pichia californica]|nr:Protein phosphatase 2C 2 [[Candida] californica]
MGQILSHPKTEKSSEEGGDKFVAYGLSCMQGWRVSMEDSHSIILDLNSISDNDNNTNHKPLNQNAFFAIYDGHGGEKVALFTGENLPKILVKNENYKNGNFIQSLKDTFLATDVAILNDSEISKDPSGCAATSTLITKNSIYCANAGDSRSILSINGIVKPLSFDHKPTNEGEKNRIVNAGGFVDMGRVNGNLALSRGIGDFEFKDSKLLPPEEQAVTALPDVLEHNLNTENDEFIVLACDGIWDCLTSQQVVDFVRKYIKENKTLTEICELMMNTCLAPTSGGSGIGCDNMSVCIVALLHNGETLDQWYQRISNKITDEDFKNLPSADDLSNDLYKIDLETKLSDTKDDDSSFTNGKLSSLRSISKDNDDDDDDDDNNDNDNNNKNDDESVLKGTPAFLQQLLAASAASRNNNVIYLDPSATSILQSLGVMEEDGEINHEIEEEEEDNNDAEDNKIEEISDDKEKDK